MGTPIIGIAKTTISISVDFLLVQERQIF